MVHPASFNCLTAMRDLPFNSGMTFAVVAFSDRSGQLIFPNSVDIMNFLLGIVTLTGLGSFLMSVNSAFGVTKYSVAPESMTP